jgi:hypothetical protein
MPECYFERMGLLVLVLGLCCGGLLLLAGLLWVMVRERSAPTAPLLVAPRVESSARMLMVRTGFIHPRMDLASGKVPENQAVDLERRRERRLEHASTPRRRRTVGFAPFAERRKLPRGRRQRLDLVYALEGMGDLSDPDLRPARQWIADLQAAMPAK